MCIYIHTHIYIYITHAKNNNGSLGQCFSICGIRFLLLQWYLYMFCIVTVVSVHVLYCDSGTCTYFILCQRYVYVFCIVPVVGVQVLYCESGR